MPSLELKTNVKLDDPKPLIQELSKYAAETLGKPENFVCVNYLHNENMTWQGTFDPALLLTIISLDNLSPEANIEYSKKFFDFFEKKLGVPSTRGYISFTDSGRDYVGYGGTTMGPLLKGN
ncbi:Tautomerase/MIF [Trametopsis cervina]|nr:Tautomerase/MIF [Trametopsis cervina]